MLKSKEKRALSVKFSQRALKGDLINLNYSGAAIIRLLLQMLHVNVE